MELLLYLADSPGSVVSVRQLKQSVWGREHVVDEAVKRCICQIRRAFSDDPRESRVIQTVRKRGYRLVAEIDRRPLLPKLRGWRMATLGLAASLIILFSGSSQPVANVDGQPFIPASLDIHSAARAHYLKYDQDDMLASVALYEHLALLDPSDAAAHAGLANGLMQVYLRWGRDETIAARAFDAAKRAVELDRELAQAHKALGTYFHFRGEREIALQHYAAAVQRDPGYWNALNNGAEILRDLGEYNAARNLFSCALTAATRKADVLLRLADVEFRDGRYEQATDYIEIARLLEPSNRDIGAIEERVNQAGGAALPREFDESPARALDNDLVAVFEQFRCPGGQNLAARNSQNFAVSG